MKHNLEPYFDFLESWEKLDDSSKLESINSIFDFFENSYAQNAYGESVIDLASFYDIIWKRLSPGIQEIASSEMVEHVKSHILQGDIEFKDVDYKLSRLYSSFGNTLSRIFHNQSEEIKHELFETLKEIIPLDKYPANKEHRNLFDDIMRDIWIDAPLETQEKNPEMLDSLLLLSQSLYEEKLEGTKKLEKLFSPSKYQDIFDRNEKEFSKYRDTNCLELIENTKFKLSKKHFQDLVKYNKIEANNIDELYNLYEQIFEYNININSTLSIETLSELGSNIDIMKLIRISSCNTELQKNLVQIMQLNTATKQIILNSINNSDYWDTELSAINKNYFSFRKLFENIDNENIELSDENISSLKNIMLQKNYFNIQNVDEISHYEDIKNSICKKILNGEELGQEYKFINQMTKSEKEKFAILEMQYGISLEDAINLVQKYGTDIDEIEEQEFSDVITQIKNLKKIINANNIGELYEENKNNLDSFFGRMAHIPTDLDNECLNLYAKLYQKDFDEHSIDANIESTLEVQHDDTSVKIAKVSPYKIVDGKKKRSEISAFARVEGAYANWSEPDNFRKALETPSISYHGNCKSAIRSNSIGIARPSGPTYGYTTCPPNTLKLMAPWDIVSTQGNLSFAINSLSWNENVGLLSTKRISGVQFRIPSKNTDFTRHGHNEAVSERLVINGKKFTKDEPNFILFISEAGETVEDYENLLASKDFSEKLELAKQKEKDFTDEEYKILNADRWRISKKAASQLGKEIYIIDKDEFRECEETRFLQLLEAFENPKNKIDFIEEADSKLSEPELLERIIVEFENNVSGNIFSRNKGLFDEANRESIYNRIQSKIKSYKRSNSELYSILSEKLEETCQSEYSKAYTNVEKEVSTPDFKKFYEEKALELGTKREYDTGNDIKALDFDETGVQYSRKINETIEEINKTDLYEGNKAHSIEHIDKVILFAGLLAKNEGLDEKATNLLLTASAFHDSGRKRIEDKYSQDADVPHAVESAFEIYRFLRENPNNAFGITEENIGILQVAIHYHEHKEPNIGELDVDTIKTLCDTYQVKPEDFETTLKISELLKDADALDRTRFSEHGKLDIRYLKSESARKKSMISYAQNVNKHYAKQMLSSEYDINDEQLGNENPISRLHDERKKTYGYHNVDRKKTESHLPISQILEMMQSTKAYVPEPEEKTGMLMRLYDMFGVDKQSISQAKEFIKKTLDKIKTSFIERS